MRCRNAISAIDAVRHCVSRGGAGRNHFAEAGLAFLARPLSVSRIQKNSPISGAVLEAPGNFETPSPFRISRNTLWC
jgi:hypothetical protein